jgi:MSHA biogenesis protein MshO
MRQRISPFFNPTRAARGFTLLEMIIAMVILGVIASMVAVFMKSPVDAYFSSARRAGLTDVADTTTRRIARDLRKALPNTIRQSSSQCIEFIPTRTGGRYRTQTDNAGGGDPLDFTVADSTFDMLGLNSDLPAAQQIQPNDVIVVYNLGISPSSDAYVGAVNGGNSAVVASVGAGSLANETKISFTAAKQFPLASGSNRFHVVPGNETIVSYVCANNNLYRNTNYAYGGTTPQCPTTGGSLLAKNVSSCVFTYNPSDQRNAVVQLSMQFSDLTPGSANAETVSLYHEVHVDNTP